MTRTRRLASLLTQPPSAREAPSDAATRPPSPTPSSPEKDDRVTKQPRRLRSRSRSPTKAADKPLAANMSARRSDEIQSWARRSPTSAALKPIITQETVPMAMPDVGSSPVADTHAGDDTDKQSSIGPASSVGLSSIGPASSVGPTRPRLRIPQLLDDSSQYSAPGVAPEKNSLTLEELAHLVRLSKYQERKRATTRVRLQRSLVSTAISARLTRCGAMAYRNLVSSFRAQDKKSFASLYKAAHDVRLSCMESRKFAMLEPEMESMSLQSPGMASSESLNAQRGGQPGAAVSAAESVVPFLNDISPSSKHALLNFLTKLRNNPDFLAARLCSLDSTELSTLKTFNQNPEPIDSVLPSPGGGGGSSRSSASTFRDRTLRSISQKISSHSQTHSHATTHIEQLLSFQRHDPLSALIHTCFANSAGPDSAEDRRRTDIWATALARLISEQRTGNDSILSSVLNAWTSMRDWAGRSNMEWYLMKILEDGSFILDKAEDQKGTLFNISQWPRDDPNSAERFYDRAVEGLFELLDDEDETGIPEGFVELGNEILKKLDSQYVEGAKRGLISGWLFNVWLLEVIIYPETRGIMAEYHITDYGRQKILKTVALRAAGLVQDVMSHKMVKPEVARHIDNILNRFGPSRSSKSKTRLLPARSLTSLRETVEVHPFLLISPADLVTMVNALFPEKRPQSGQSGRLMSGANSISGFSAISQPISLVPSRGPYTNDAASVLSTSVSSATSEAATTANEPLLTSRESPPLGFPGRVTNYEDDGYVLREALHEMTQSLGQDVVQGTCHPCSERWAVLFISPDGNSLSTQMTYDPEEDDPEDDDRSTSSGSDDEEDAEDGSLDLDKDYHKLRDSILRLVEDFEIPQEKSAVGHLPTFSNRTNPTLRKYRSRNKIISTEYHGTSRSSRSSHRRESISSNGLEIQPPSDIVQEEDELAGTSSMDSTGSNGAESVLVAMLTAASAQARARSDFVAAHQYWHTLQRLNALTSPSLRANGFAVLLNIFSRGPRVSIRRSAAAIEEYDAWLVWLRQSQERAEGAIDAIMKRVSSLRDKAWYVIDVRNSSPYDLSSKIAAALKSMGSPARPNPPSSSRLPFMNFGEAQMTELLSGGKEWGLCNKLSDDHSDTTAKWLRHHQVVNFCKGEERIHRLCMEVDSCVNKLVGDGVTPGPELWTNELYSVDRGNLDRSKTRERDWDDGSSVISDIERRYPPAPRSFNSLPRDLRSVASLNMSHHSFDSARFSFSRTPGFGSSDGPDSQSYFGASSPVHTIDSSITYWSQFQSALSPQSGIPRAQSPTTTSLTSLSGSFSLPQPQHYGTPGTQHSVGSGRPGTSASSNETVLQQRLSEEKSRFLVRLRHTLTSLLLSDLGNLVFAKGSETDVWFQDLGQRTIKHSDQKERQRQQQQAAAKAEKRRSRTHVPSQAQPTTEQAPASTSWDDVFGPSVTVHEPAVPAQDNPTPPAEKPRPKRKAKAPEFPFIKAYRRLLRMFCVHPNPYVKLDALYELEHLIVASLAMNNSKKRSGPFGRAAKISEQNSIQEDASTSPRPVDKVMDNVKERRSQTLTMRSQVPLAGPSNTDAIVNMLCSLFRDEAVRPKTLFRDLQFIGSFVTAETLDSDKGVAFWNAGLAALRLKQEVCETMVSVAYGIFNPSRSVISESVPATAMPTIDGSSAASTTERNDEYPRPPRTPSPPPFNSEDKPGAAKMYLISAKESHAVAQRELALLYLGAPELVERATVPLSKLSGVFRDRILEQYAAGKLSGGAGGRAGGSIGGGVGLHGQGGGGGGPGGGAGDVRRDPVPMCLASHWMQAAGEGGDKEAMDFIKQQGEFLENR